MTATNALRQGMPATGGESFDLQALTRALVESALNAIMDEQAGMACEGGANSRNGYRERGLVTPADKITLRIPKLRCGTYFPEGMLERHGWADKAVAAAVAEMYANGVSTRKVERIAQRMASTGCRRRRSDAYASGSMPKSPHFGRGNSTWPCRASSWMSPTSSAAARTACSPPPWSPP